jgi:hypothetical protein
VEAGGILPFARGGSQAPLRLFNFQEQSGAAMDLMLAWDATDATSPQDGISKL